MLWVLIVAHGIFALCCSVWTLSCSMWDLVSWSGIESGPLHWEHGVLATALQGKSLFFFLNCFSFVSAFPHLLLHVGEIFNCNIFKIFLIPFLFLFFFWDPYNSNVGAFDMVKYQSLRGLWDFPQLFSFFVLYSALQKLFPPFYLPAHWFVLLFQIFCYWFLLEYF